MDVQRKLYVGIVEDNKDPNRKGRIKVRVQTLFNDIPVEDIPYASPFMGLAGKDYQIPAIGKIVNILFLSDDIYDPCYIYTEYYNINLQNKLKYLSEDEYIDFVALLFDERTQIYADSQELTIDHLFNKLTINNSTINLELKDNTQQLNLGCKVSEQEAVLGTHFFEWLDRFMSELAKPTSMIGNLGAPIIKPKINKLIAEYNIIRDTFVSKHVKIVDNDKVAKLKRIPTTSNKKDDDYKIVPTDEMSPADVANQNILNAKVKAQNDDACQKMKNAAPTSYTAPNSSMVIPLLGSRLSSRFGLRQDPTNPSKTQGHSGLDIVAPIGSTIISPDDGTVIGTGFDDVYGGGNFIRIKHTNGFTTGYAHLSKVLVKQNQKVKKEDKIGLVGNTGGHTTGPHLHFTVTTPAGEKVDPTLYFTWPYDTQAVASNSADGQYQGSDYQIENNPKENSISGGAPCNQTPDSEKDDNTSESPLSLDSGPVTYEKMVELIVANIEGGYWHPNMFKDGRLRYNSLYDISAETMFGIDRGNYIGKNDVSVPLGSGKMKNVTKGTAKNQYTIEFWGIIDNENAKDTWKWGYKGGNLQPKLAGLVANIMKPNYTSFSDKYLSPQAKAIVNSYAPLTFNFIYATWNGSGWFQKFAKKVNNAVDSGITDPKQLANIAIDSRTSSASTLIKMGAPKIKSVMDDLRNYA